jgi:CelD/BcsL family acetyltransferase involved in cellulose biosynthesis
LPAAGASVRRPPLTLVGRAGQVAVLRTEEKVEELRDAWQELRGDNVDTDPDYFLWSLRHEPHVVRPHVLALGAGPRPGTIVAARIVDVRLPCRLGKSTLYAPRVRALCVLRHGVLGRLDAETAAAIVEELRGALERGDADVILFRHLERGSALHRAAAADASPAARRQHAARTNLRWQIDLGRGHAGYLASLSASTRKATRRTTARLERELGDRLAIRVYRGASEVEACLDDVEEVAARTYQRRLGVGYLGDERQRARLKLLASHGWFHASVLYLDGQPVAFELGELYGGRFHSLAGAYDPAHGDLRVGAHLLLQTIGALADAGDASLFDFGFGDAPYKRKLSHRAAEEGDFVVYARRPRPMAISAIRTVLLELSHVLTAGLDRVALLERLRHAARRAPRIRRAPAAGYSSAACVTRPSRSS